MPDLVSAFDSVEIKVGFRITFVGLDSITWTDELVSMFKVLVEKVFVVVFEIIEVVFSVGFSPLTVALVFSSFFEDFVTLT